MSVGLALLTVLGSTNQAKPAASAADCMLALHSVSCAVHPQALAVVCVYVSVEPSLSVISYSAFGRSNIVPVLSIPYVHSCDSTHSGVPSQHDHTYTSHPQR